MPTLLQSWPTKLGALLLGAALGMAGFRGQSLSSTGTPARVESPPPAQARIRQGGDREERGSRSNRTPVVSSARSGEAYAAAWDSLKDGKLPRKDRLEIQRLLLAEWAEIDLESALHAALSDPADNPFNFGSEPLMNACDLAMSRHQDTVWELIHRHAFGPRTADVRREWTRAKGLSDPLGLLSHFDELPPWLDARHSMPMRKIAVGVALRGAHTKGADPALGRETIARLLTIPSESGGIEAVDALREWLPDQSSAALSQGVQTAEEPVVREIYLQALIYKMRLIDRDVDEKVGRWVPAELRAEVTARLRALGEQ